MRLIIEVRIENEDGGASREDGTVVMMISRRERNLSQLGLTLAEGRSLLAEVQAVLASQQAAQWIAGETDCRHCGSPLSHKDSRSIVLRTVFGKVRLKSPRLWTCACRKAPRRTSSPLSKALPKRVTPELEYLQVKWAAHLPYRTATVLLKEMPPLDKTISFSGARNRVHAVGKALDAPIERNIARQPKAMAGSREAK
jgi:hypothetical protein